MTAFPMPLLTVMTPVNVPASVAVTVATGG